MRRDMMRRGKCVVSLLTTLLLLVVPVAVQPEGAVAAPQAASIGNRYQDGLDSRFAAERFAQSTAALGYGSSSYTSGRSASDAWGDGLRSAVFGFFGHSNAGFAQVREGSTDPADEFLAAGLDGDVGAGNLSFWSEYLPFIDVDDMKLAIFGGCYTGYSSQDWGSFGAVGREKGVDSVVGFRGLVYYPANCTSATTQATTSGTASRPTPRRGTRSERRSPRRTRISSPRRAPLVAGISGTCRER